MLEKNSDNVKIVFKNFPLSFHKMADPAHRAAMAANQQGKFWEMHDKLFAAKKLSNKFINSTAEEIGLDMAKFKKDMNSQKIRQQIRKDQVDAKNAGVTGTPSIFINGRQLSKRTPQGFQQMIDQELNKAGK